MPLGFFGLFCGVPILRTTRVPTQKPDVGVSEGGGGLMQAIADGGVKTPASHSVVRARSESGRAPPPVAGRFPRGEGRLGGRPPSGNTLWTVSPASYSSFPFVSSHGNGIPHGFSPFTFDPAADASATEEAVIVFVGPRKSREKNRGTVREACTRTRSAAGKATDTSLAGERVEVATLSFAANARARLSARARTPGSDQLPLMKAEAPASAPASVHRWSSWRAVYMYPTSTPRAVIPNNARRPARKTRSTWPRFPDFMCRLRAISAICSVF